jgi:hypothetical protein
LDEGHTHTVPAGRDEVATPLPARVMVFNAHA